MCRLVLVEQDSIDSGRTGNMLEIASSPLMGFLDLRLRLHHFHQMKYSVKAFNSSEYLTG